MKQMKKICCAVLAMLFLVLSGCGKAEEPAVSLYDEGMDVVSLMAETVGSEDYGAMLSSSTEIQEVAETLAAGDYAAPQAVYEVSAPSVEKILELYGGEGELDGLSETLTRYLEQRFPAMAINQLNAQAGVTALAASSVYTAGKTFARCALAEPVIYVYSFAEGTPVAVVFVPGENGAASASGTFLLGDAFADGDELLPALEAAFQLYGCTVTPLDIP